MRILAFDVSGNFEEGKGTTGICRLDAAGTPYLYELKASEYNCKEAYWDDHINYIIRWRPDVLVVEGFRLYQSKSQTQVNSQFETPKLIGLLEWYAWLERLKIHIQMAAEVKTRWSDKVLVAMGILEEKNGRLYLNGKQTNNHQRDALRHALHYRRYKSEK